MSDWKGKKWLRSSAGKAFLLLLFLFSYDEAFSTVKNRDPLNRYRIKSLTHITPRSSHSSFGDLLILL